MKKTCYSLTNCTEEKIVFAKKNNYIINECSKCGYRYLDIADGESHVESVYSDEYFFDGKSAGYPNYLEEKNLLINYGTHYAKIIAKFMEPGNVLDTGCAAGFILKGFQDQGWQCTGVEPNDTMASYGRDQLHLNVHTGSFENFYSEQTFDLINMIQVIGHFYDLDACIKNVRKLLRRDGLVLVESWNSRSLLAKIMGSNWPEYSPPSVVRWFSDETLTEFFTFHGFELIKKGRPSKRISINHALSLVNEKTPEFKFKKSLMKTLNKTFGNLTVIYPPLDLKWYLFKKE